MEPVDCFQKTSILHLLRDHPRVVATGGDTQQTAHGGDWIAAVRTDFLEIGSLSRANQAAGNISRSTLSCLFSLRNFRIPASGRLCGDCLGDPVADRLFVGFKLSGQLTGAAPGSMKLDYLLAKSRSTKRLVLGIKSPFSQRIRCPRNRGNSTCSLATAKPHASVVFPAPPFRLMSATVNMARQSNILDCLDI